MTQKWLRDQKGTTNAYIEQPGKNKVMYISFRNSDRLFAMRTDDIQMKLSEAERYITAKLNESRHNQNATNWEIVLA